MKRELLENLKVGDKIFYDSSSIIGIKTIARLTPKQIILKNGERFRKNDGFLIGGDSWNFTIIRLLTSERLNQIKIQKLKNEAINLRHKLAIPNDKETLEKFIVALKPFTKKSKEK